MTYKYKRALDVLKEYGNNHQASASLIAFEEWLKNKSAFQFIPLDRDWPFPSKFKVISGEDAEVYIRQSKEKPHE